MFEMLESLVKSACAVVTVPFSAAADVITLGGSLTDKDQSYTSDAIEDLMDNLKDATRPRR